MRLLLDTHVLVWWLARPRRIPRATRDMLLDSANEVYVSAATAWEIAVKRRLGKLDFDADVLATFEDRVSGWGFEPMAISADQAVRGANIESPHKDPFDRMLAGQALTDGLTLVTADPAFASLGVSLAWWR